MKPMKTTAFLLTATDRAELEQRLRERQRALRAEIKAHLGAGTDTGIVGL